MKRKLLIGSLISAVFLFLALRDVEWRVLWAAIKGARYLFLVPSILFTIFGHYVRAYRWKFMLRPVKDVSTNRLFSATIIGLMANNLLPARLGEIVRAYVVGKSENISRTASFATIVYERVVDVFTLLALLWIALLTSSGTEWLRASGLWLLAFNAALLILIIVMDRRQTQFLRFIGFLSKLFPETLQEKIARGATGFVSGLASVSRLNTLLPIAITSILVWFFAMLSIYYCLEATNIDVPLAASLTLIVIVSLGSMIPSAPAYVGTMQYACILSLAIYGVGKSEALAYSLLYHASQFLPLTLLGFYYLWKSQVRLGEITRGTSDKRS